MCRKEYQFSNLWHKTTNNGSYIETKCGRGQRMYVPLVFLRINQHTQMQVLSLLVLSRLVLSLLVLSPLNLMQVFSCTASNAGV